MSTNMVYHSNTSQDNILLHQPNPAYIKASDIHIYDEIPAGQYEEFVPVKKTNLHSNDDDDANQDNESYVSQLVNQQDQDYGGYDHLFSQDNESYISQVNQQNHKESVGCADSLTIDDEDK